MFLFKPLSRHEYCEQVIRNVRQGSSLKLKLAAYDICCKISVDF